MCIMERFRLLFPRHSLANLVCMLHLPPLPGSPQSRLSPEQITDHACQQAERYLRVMGAEAVDAFLVENMGDLPYVLPADMGPETATCMAVACRQVRNQVPKDIPVGVQVLAGANREALAVAKAAGLQFVRAEGFVFRKEKTRTGFCRFILGSSLKLKRISCKNGKQTF